VYAADHDVDAALAAVAGCAPRSTGGRSDRCARRRRRRAHSHPPAPGGYDPDSISTQAALDDALAAGDATALTRLPDTIVGRVAYQVLAGLVEPAPRSAKELYRGAPYGVGYFAGVWLRRVGAVGAPARRAGRRLGNRQGETARDHRPDGTGKSALALAVAERVGGEIVNADAMQLYRGMDLGAAKLSASARRGIAHHQLDVLDVTETASVARYQQAAAADIEAIAARGAVPVVVGGSMMYIQSLLDEWSFPATDAAVRAKMGGEAGRDRRGWDAR